MALLALTDEFIEDVLDAKVKYSILEYNRQGHDYQSFYSEENPRVATNIIDLSDKYQNALNINNGNISHTDYQLYVDKLEKAAKIIKYVKSQNQETLDTYADSLVNELLKGINEKTNDVEKCKYIFEYVTTAFETYSSEIPFDSSYDTLFYKNIPVSGSYKGLAITSKGNSNEICCFIKYLGTKFGLDIDIINCEYNGEPYSINSIEINGEKTYMDAASVISKRRSYEDSLLVSRDVLIKDNGNFVGVQGRYYTEEQTKKLSLGFRRITEPGVTIECDKSKKYNFNNIIKKRDGLFDSVIYYELNNLGKRL